MTPSITPCSIPYIPQPSSEILTSTLPSNFESLTFLEKLKVIGLIDNRFNLLFTPSEIPSISNRGQSRWNQLLERNVCSRTDEGEIIINMKHSEYISGFANSLKENGVKTKTFLRGGYAAYVACLSDYFEFLIHEFLASKKLPKDLLFKEIEAFKKENEEPPHDVDLFDHVESNIPPSDLCGFHIAYLAKASDHGNYQKIKSKGFIQLLIPKVTSIFPYPEDYVLFTIGAKNEKFQTDRIIGRLHHEYLHVRDDIRLEIKDNTIHAPESFCNFWQMVIDRKLKIVRTESWHEKDFRAGLAALQLIQDGHYLIEDNCRLESIFQYALSTGSIDIFKGAIKRAELHSKNPFEFLLCTLIAYSHSAQKMGREIPEEHLEILNSALSKIGEILPLTSVYHLALLLTLFEDKKGPYRVEWDTAGKDLLTLYLNNQPIIFPKNFSKKFAHEKSLISPLFSSWVKKDTCHAQNIYAILDGNLPHLERLLFELALQKDTSPLSQQLMDALVEYLIHTDNLKERIVLAKMLHPRLTPSAPQNLAWIKTLLTYSFKHGLKLWNAIKPSMKEHKRLEAFEEIIQLIAFERPNFSFVLLEEEAIPVSLKLKLLKALIKSPGLSPANAVRIIEDLLKNNALGNDFEMFLIRTIENLPVEEGYLLWKKIEPAITPSPKLLQAIDHLITSGDKLDFADEFWFFNTLPSQERIEALFLNLKGNKDAWAILLKWVTWKLTLNQPQDSYEALEVFKNHKDEIRTHPDIYIKFIKQIHQVIDKDGALLMQSLGKEWIDSFPLPERMHQAILFFNPYEPLDYPLLEIICSLNGINKQKLIEALYQKGQPIFLKRSLNDLLTFLNYDFSPTIKSEILKNLAKKTFHDKELTTLQRFAKTNPSLSLELIFYQLQNANIAALSFIINHLIFLKKEKSIGEKLFNPLWLKSLDFTFKYPSHLTCLIPFFQDRRWVKTVYGEESENKTLEWGERVLTGGKIKKLDQVSVENILSRRKLNSTPLMQLKSFLNSLSSKKIIQEDELKTYFFDAISKLTYTLQNENLEDHFHTIDIFIKLFKLGMTSQIITARELENLKGVYWIPTLHYEDSAFNPLVDLLKNFPLIDFSSSELYDQWNHSRTKIIKKFMEEDSNRGNFIKSNLDSLKFLPYPLLKMSLEHAFKFKLITEQYIENKATKEEFQEEIQAISQSALQSLKNQELMASEEPWLICIQDLSFFMKNNDNKIRERAYEAFYFILNQRKNNTDNLIEEQRTYLKIRQEVENLIIKNSHLIEKKTIIHFEYYNSFRKHCQTLIKSPTLKNIHLQDPVFDALELESLSLMDKLELQKIWFDIIVRSNCSYNPFQENKIKCYTALETNQLIEKDVEKYFQNRILTLKAKLRSLSDSVIMSEMSMIATSSAQTLSEAKAASIKTYMEKTLSRNISYTTT